MSDEEIMALMPTLFFFSIAFHPHTVTYQQHAKTKNTSHRSSSILNSVKWLLIDEVWSVEAVLTIRPTEEVRAHTRGHNL